MQSDPSFLLEDSFELFPFCAECCRARRANFLSKEDLVQSLFHFDTDMDNRDFCISILKSYGVAIEEQLKQNSECYLPGGKFYDGREEWNAKLLEIDHKLSTETSKSQRKKLSAQQSKLQAKRGSLVLPSNASERIELRSERSGATKESPPTSRRMPPPPKPTRHVDADSHWAASVCNCGDHGVQHCSGTI